MAKEINFKFKKFDLSHQIKEKEREREREKERREKEKLIY